MFEQLPYIITLSKQEAWLCVSRISTVAHSRWNHDPNNNNGDDSVWLQYNKGCDDSDYFCQIGIWCKNDDKEIWNDQWLIQ